jgi:hypothetical protein
MHNTLEIGVYVFFYFIEQHYKFLLHTWKVLKCGAGGGWKRSVGLIM